MSNRLCGTASASRGVSKIIIIIIIIIIKKIIMIITIIIMNQSINQSKGNLQYAGNLNRQPVYKFD